MQSSALGTAPAGAFSNAVFQRVVIISMRSIGDVVLATPAIRAIRLHLPIAHLSVLVLVGSAQVLARNPDVDEVLVASNEELTTGPLRARAASHLRLIRRLRQGRFDLLIDLTDSDRTAVLSGLSGARRRVGLSSQSRLRGLWYHTAVRPVVPRQHIVDYHRQVLRALAIAASSRLSDAPDELVLPVAGEDLEAATRLAERAGAVRGGGFVVMHPGAWRRCPAWPLEHYAALADRIQETLRLPVLIVGTEGEEEAVGILCRAMRTPRRSVVGQTTLLQLAALIQQARVFIGGNSGPMHIAAALKTPVVAMFGPATELGIMTPWGLGHTVFCAERPGQSIGTDEVYLAVEAALQRHPDHRTTSGTQTSHPCQEDHR